MVKLAQTTPAEAPASCVEEERTRDRVAREVLEHGPVTAAQVSQALHLTPAAVRRHLDQLTDAGLVTTHEAPVLRRGRGRPARRFVLTPRGHAAMSTEYDDLAAAALEFLAQVAGEEAVRAFAQTRVAELEARYSPVVEAAGDAPGDRAAALAAALDADGYAASARPLSAAGATVGTQLCQGHCPVQSVAARFPQLCEAETEAFSRLLGAHVQRLATLAHGEHVCTTHVPNGPTSPTPSTSTSTTSARHRDERTAP